MKKRSIAFGWLLVTGLLLQNGCASIGPRSGAAQVRTVTPAAVTGCKEKPRDYVVQFKSDATLKKFLAENATMKITARVDTFRPNIEALQLDANRLHVLDEGMLLYVLPTECVAILEKAQASGYLVYDLDESVQLLTTPSDADFNQQCGLHTIGAESAWDDVDPDAAKDIKVAIVDSGVFRHDDLSVQNSQTDYYGHGTHIAGVIGALQNGKGVVGVVWNVKLYGYRFTDPFGEGTLGNAVVQLKYALADQPNIVVMAWGVSVPNNLKEVIDQHPEVLFVAAAGNSKEDLDRNPVYPAAFAEDSVTGKHLISVMATTCGDDKPADFTSYSKSNRVDLAAPGAAMSTAPDCVDGCNTCPHGILSTVLNNRICCQKGTSMAAAFVAGGAALVWPRIKSVPAEKVAEQVKTCLVQSVLTVPALKNMCSSEGRLNLRKAVDRAIRPASCQ